MNTKNNLKENLKTYLQGGDLRSIAGADKLTVQIKTQEEFETLFQFLYFKDRLIVMRAIDTIEKITLTNLEFLSNHKQDIINLLNLAVNKEMLWHLALLASRINLSGVELETVWKRLKILAMDKHESKIVSVNSIQSLFDLSR